MNDYQELTYEQVRKLALAQHVDDNKISIGVWAKQNGYFKKKRQRDNRVYTVYIKINNYNVNNENDYEQPND
ncbi:MAG: hypothetical protein LUH50_15765 [Bacteroides intestinalis]|nr:hypothetical protein [Bacteroides intestinalis]